MHSYEVAELGLEPCSGESQALSPKCPAPQPQSQIYVPRQTKPVIPLYHCLTRPKFSCPCVSQVTLQSPLLKKKKKNLWSKRGKVLHATMSPVRVTGYMKAVHVAMLHKTEMSCNKGSPRAWLSSLLLKLL